MLDSLDADAIRLWCAAVLAGLQRHQQEIDELNVFPVPDGDTGTNLVLTFSAASEKLAAASANGTDGLPETMLAFARGALLGARGNSGVIMSQLLAGLAGAFTMTSVSGRALASALTDAADSAYRSVAEPVEGTILSVARAAARSAGAADSDDLVRVARAAAAGAAVALAHTPRQLPALARAGVVDAGGKGLVVLLDALVEVITGESAPEVPVQAPPRDLSPVRESGSSEYAYEVQFLLDAPIAAMDGLKGALSAIGDSLALVGAGPIGARDEDGADVPTWNVHVHTNDVGAAIEAGIVAGRPHRISVTRFADQIAGRAADALRTPEPRSYDRDGRHIAMRPEPGAGTLSRHRRDQDALASEHPDGAEPFAPFEPAAIAGDLLVSANTDVTPDRAKRATVVVANGDGVADLVAGAGAAVVAGPNPSTAEILAAIRETGASRVVIIPDAAATRGTAEAAAAECRDEGVHVSIVPTRSPVQALAALAVRDAGRRFEDDVIAMAEAAGACRYAELTHAIREALTVAGRCREGDVLALVEGEVNLIGTDLVATGCDLLDRMLAGGGELVTLLLGSGAPDDFGDALVAHLGAAWPFVEVQVYDGGQPNYPLLVGVE